MSTKSNIAEQILYVAIDDIDVSANIRGQEDKDIDQCMAGWRITQRAESSERFQVMEAVRCYTSGMEGARIFPIKWFLIGQPGRGYIAHNLTPNSDARS